MGANGGRQRKKTETRDCSADVKNKENRDDLLEKYRQCSSQAALKSSRKHRNECSRIREEAQNNLRKKVDNTNENPKLLNKYSDWVLRWKGS